MYGHALPGVSYPSTISHIRPEGEGPRSRLLDEFRANRARKWELRDVWHHVVEFSSDQHGSRFIQQKIETATPDEKQRAFEEIVPNAILPLIQNVFGNYVIQKLFEHGTSLQKAILANALEGHALMFSLHVYGCRVIQKGIECMTPEQQGTLVRELEPHTLKCIQDINGNHVVQKIIECLPPDRLGFLSALRGHVHQLGSNPYGCRVLQRCFENLPDDFARPLLDEVHVHSLELMQDQFGNYVIQYLVEHGKPQDRAILSSKIRNNFLALSRHKYASNVCEKCLLSASPEMRHALIDLLLKHNEGNLSPVVLMMKDQFANYVLQKALTVVEGEQKDALFAKVRSQLPGMRRSGGSYSKHVSSSEFLISPFRHH
ncbi:armadillo-type protein [Mycena floridula]|nr:armadillo-type protein [Mycena floridula]